MCIIFTITATLFLTIQAIRAANMGLQDILFIKPHIVAIASGLIFPVACIISYGLAIYLGHIEAVITYISDTGTDPPISGIFGLSLSTSLFLIGLIACVRHSFVNEVCATHPEIVTARVYLANTASGWLAFISIASMVIVAHFQVHTSLIVHGIGAVVGIGCGVIYFCLQSICSKAMVPKYTSPKILYIRISLASISVVSFIFGVSCGLVSLAQFDGKEMHRWTPRDGGYIAHAISSVCEWILALTYSIFFLTYASEFIKIQIQPAKVILSNSNVTNRAFGAGRNLETEEGLFHQSSIMRSAHVI